MAIAIYFAIALHTCATDAAMSRNDDSILAGAACSHAVVAADVIVIFGAYNHTQDFPEWSKGDF